MKTILELLNWRYATKKMDPSIKVSDEKVSRILEAIRMSASSSGLQPYQVIVVTNKELREQLKPFAWNQEQITDCSHLLVFAAWDTYTSDRVNSMFDLVNEVRGFKNEGWERYRQSILDNYPGRPEEVNFQHAARQAYIGLGSALIAAAEQEVDSTPMEGFEPDRFDEILGLRSRGLRSVVILPLGYRKADGDWLVHLKKVRRTMDEFLIEMK